MHSDIHRPQTYVNCVCSSGQWLASGSEDSTIKIWDLVAGKIVSTLSEGHEDAVNALAFHPQDFLLVSGSTDRTTRFWNLDTFKHEESLSRIVTDSRNTVKTTTSLLEPIVH